MYTMNDLIYKLPFQIIPTLKVENGKIPSPPAVRCGRVWRRATGWSRPSVHPLVVVKKTAVNAEGQKQLDEELLRFQLQFLGNTPNTADKTGRIASQPFLRFSQTQTVWLSFLQRKWWEISSTDLSIVHFEPSGSFWVKIVMSNQIKRHKRWSLYRTTDSIFICYFHVRGGTQMKMYWFSNYLILNNWVLVVFQYLRLKSGIFSRFE